MPVEAIRVAHYNDNDNKSFSNSDHASERQSRDQNPENISQE